MKKRISVGILILFVIALFSCNGNSTNKSIPVKDSISVADSQKLVTDTTK